MLNLFENESYIMDVKVNGLKINLKLEFQSNVFDDVRKRFVSAHFIVTSNVFTVRNRRKPQTMYISNLTG